MTTVQRPEFRNRVNAVLDGLLREFYSLAPTAKYFAESKDIDVELFKRHTIETILRIRLARVADSKAILLFTKTDPFAAQKWAKYMEEEMLHDRLFLKDLERLDVPAHVVYGTDPLLATKLLQGYLYYTMEHEGPRGLIAKSYFVEYMTLKTQSLWNANIEGSLGEGAVKGAKAHLHYDDTEDHSSDVWNVLIKTVNSEEEEERVLYHLRVYYGLFVAYFNELAHSVKDKPIHVPAIAVDAAIRTAAPPDVA